MKKIISSLGLILVLALQSCFDSSKPNYQYFPDMYEPVGYETYSSLSIFTDEMVARLPVEGTIPRGWTLYEYPDTSEGYDAAKINLQSPLETNEENLAAGKKLYGIYCAVCHGTKGDGQGILATREKFLGVPSYTDREITQGSIYHVLMYGRNAMGSHAGQINATERWQVSQYVIALRNQLKK